MSLNTRIPDLRWRKADSKFPRKDSKQTKRAQDSSAVRVACFPELRECRRCERALVYSKEVAS